MQFFYLEYKPNRPFYAGMTGGNPLKQIIPSGGPLPANSDNGTTIKSIQNRIKETITEKPGSGN